MVKINNKNHKITLTPIPAKSQNLEISIKIKIQDMSTDEIYSTELTKNGVSNSLIWLLARSMTKFYQTLAEQFKPSDEVSLDYS